MNSYEEFTGSTVILPPFTGERQLVIHAEDSVMVERSIDSGKTFFPYTDNAGDFVIIDGQPIGPAYNNSLSTNSMSVRFRLVSDSDMTVRFSK